jgi:hypothetical protein
MFTLNLRDAQHTRPYSIAPAGPNGWEVRLEEDRILSVEESITETHDRFDLPPRGPQLAP